MHTLLALLFVTRIAPVSETVPSRQPQMAASGDTVAMVYASGRSILFAKSKDQGATFSKPSIIAEMPILPASRHRGPRVTFSGKTLVVTAIGGKTLATGPHAHGLPADGDLFAWRSTDGGSTWAGPVTVNDVPGAAREGLHALASNAGGTLATAWLDLRSKGTRLYASISKDAGATWSKSTLVYESPDGSICQCCHPSILATGRGEFTVMFRNALDGKRDMYLATLRNGEVTGAPRKVGTKSWEINACPMDGGGIAMANGKIVTAWRRGEELFLAPVGKEETKIGTGKDVALVTQNGKSYAVWINQSKVEASVDGQTTAIGSSGAFPSLVALPSGAVLAAWEESGSIAVRRVN